MLNWRSQPSCKVDGCGVRVFYKYKGLCLVLKREVVSCRGGNVLRPSILEVVKLEVGNMSRKEESHITGTKHILLNYTVCQNFPAVGTGR